MIPVIHPELNRLIGRSPRLQPPAKGANPATSHEVEPAQGTIAGGALQGRGSQQHGEISRRSGVGAKETTSGPHRGHPFAIVTVQLRQACARNRSPACLQRCRLGRKRGMDLAGLPLSLARPRESPSSCDGFAPWVWGQQQPLASQRSPTHAGWISGLWP